MADDERIVRDVLEARSAAIGERDIERLMSLYAPQIIYFDLVPPLQYRGTAALRERFLDWFGRWSSPIGQALDQVEVAGDGDVATASMLIHASGTLKTGQQVDYWVRTTNAFRRLGGKWLILHEHVSFPVDLKTRSAVMDLKP
jgi:ketosteroid isomerase-like protein